MSFALFGWLLDPSLGFGDAGEFAAAAHVWGITHPPGNPLAIALFRAIEATIPISNVAALFNWVNAFFAACGIGCWFLVVESVSRPLFNNAWKSTVVAFCAAGLIATSLTVLLQATAFERTFLLQADVAALVAYLLFDVTERSDRDHSRRFILACYLTALAAGIHLFAIFSGLTLSIILMTRFRRLISRNLLTKLCVSVLLGVSTYLTIPLRAVQHPEVNWGELADCPKINPANCGASLFVNPRLIAHLKRDYYRRADDSRHATAAIQFGAWWKYFRAQWHASCGDYDNASSVVVALFFALLIVGALAHWRHGPSWSAFAFTSLVIVHTGFLIWFLNFRPMPTQVGGLFGSVPTEMRDRDYFFMLGYMCCTCWIAIGVGRVGDGILSTVTSIFAKYLKASSSRVRGVLQFTVFSLPAISIVGYPLVINTQRVAANRGDAIPLAWAHDVLNSTKRRSVLITSFDDDLWPLMYAQVVENFRRDVILLPFGNVKEPWFREQLARKGLVLSGIEDSSWIYDLRQIRDSKRPLFFTLDAKHQAAIAFPKDLVLTAGFAAEVVSRASQSLVDTVSYPSLGIVDVEQHVTLWESSEGPKRLLTRKNWCDIPTQRILKWYGLSAAPVLPWLALRAGPGKIDSLMSFVRHVDDLTSEK